MTPPKHPATTTLKNASRNAVREGSVGGASGTPVGSSPCRGYVGLQIETERGGGVPMALPVAETAWPYVAPDTRVLVVIPTYNEIENIDEVLRRTRRALPDATVLVVDDNSPDGTADRVLALQRSLGDLEVLHRDAKQGLGAAYRAGFRAGLAEGYDILVEMDADLSHDPAALPDLVRAIASGADL